MLFTGKPELKTFNRMLCAVGEKEKKKKTNQTSSFLLRILILDQNVLVFIHIFHWGK